jgi:hypothetical protein
VDDLVPSLQPGPIKRRPECGEPEPGREDCVLVEGLIRRSDRVMLVRPTTCDIVRRRLDFFFYVSTLLAELVRSRASCYT